MGQTAQGMFDGVGGVIPGAGVNDVLPNAGAPGAGTSEVQTLTIGGTPSGGTFKLQFESQQTGAITWSAVTNTLLANINAALDLLPSLGTGGCVATDSTLVNGVGDVTLTFAAAREKQAVETITVFANNLTSTDSEDPATLAIVETTPGVDASYRGWPVGQVVRDTTNKVLYINTGTATAPTWTKVGTQS